MSANRAVIVLRSPSAADGASVCCGVPLIGPIPADVTDGGASAASELPQLPQNLDVGGLSVLHFGQRIARALPHCEQNLLAAGFCVPHSEQGMNDLTTRAPSNLQHV